MGKRKMEKSFLTPAAHINSTDGKGESEANEESPGKQSTESGEKKKGGMFVSSNNTDA